MSEYRSCELLEHGLCFYPSSLYSCCYSPIDENIYCPRIFYKYDGQLLDKDFLFKKINFFRKKAKENKYLISCGICYMLESKNWTEENYIDNIYITHFEKCNLNCIYCIDKFEIENRARKETTYKIVPILDKMIEDGILIRGSEIHIGGGEFTIYPECDEIIEKYILSDYCKFIAIATNGIKYSESIFKALDKQKASIIISVDAGSRNLYKKIKRADAFDKLKQTLEKYTISETARENISLKYLVLPKINDSKFEFLKFLRLSKKFKINHIIIDIEGKYLRSNNFLPNKKVTKFLEWTVSFAKQKGFKVETFSFYKQYIACSKNTKASKIKNLWNY